MPVAQPSDPPLPTGAGSYAILARDPSQEHLANLRYLDREIEWLRDEAEKKKEQEKPPPPKTNYAVGSVEWAREHGVALEDLKDL
jgi:hypothetical protein